MKQGWRRLCLAGVCILLLVTALAVPQARAAWDGTAATKFQGGNGTENSPYIIASEAQLAYFVSNINNDIEASACYVLQKNLDMTGSNWKAVKSFAGCFDGNGYRIRLNGTLFTTLASGGVVENLTLCGPEGEALAAPLLCSVCQGTIRACLVQGTWSYSGVTCGGFLCDLADKGAEIVDCGGVIGGNVSASYAGLAARAAVGSTIQSCYAVYADGFYGANHSLRYGAYRFRAIAYREAYDQPNPDELGWYSNKGGGYNYGAAALTEAEMKGEALVEKLNQTNPLQDYVWQVSSADYNSGYPTIKRGINAGLQLRVPAYQESGTLGYENTRERKVRIPDKKMPIYLACDSTSWDIYYTLDGTDPETSDTRRRYNSSTGILMDADAVRIRMVADTGSGYSVPASQTVIYMPGRGTQEQRYEIRSLDALDAVRLDLQAYYKLCADLDAGENAADWVPIGNYKTPFTGSFDGQRHVIAGLRGTAGGLFDENKGEIKNVLLKEHLLFNAAGTSGAIVNTNNGLVECCYAQSAFTEQTLPQTSSSSVSVGGIVGYAGGNSRIRGCRNGGMVGAVCIQKDAEVCIGGIVGRGDAERCINDGPVMLADGAILTHVSLGGISGNGAATDCRNNGHLTENASTNYDIVCSYGGGTISIHGTSASKRCYHAGKQTVGGKPAGGGRVHYWSPQDSYEKEALQDQRWLEKETFPEFDFETTWLMTADGPVPVGVMDADGESFDSVQAYQAATCEAAGSVTLLCAATGHTQTSAIPALGHIEVSDAAIAASCVCEGRTAGTHCARCQTVLSGRERIPMLPVSVSGGTIQYQAYETAADIPKDGARIVAARYGKGRLLAVTDTLVTADTLTGTMTLGGNGGSIRLFLVTADGWKPLGAARELREQSV